MAVPLGTSSKLRVMVRQKLIGGRKGGNGLTVPPSLVLMRSLRSGMTPSWELYGLAGALCSLAMAPVSIAMLVMAISSAYSVLPDIQVELSGPLPGSFIKLACM